MHWETIRLPDCLEKSPKINKIPKKRFQQSGQYPIVSQQKGLINGYWDDAKDVIEVDQPFVVFGDHTQEVKYVDFDFVVGADGTKLLKTKPFIEPRYFYYYLLGNPLKALGYARHYRLLKELDVAIPPLAEQKRIVAILDEAFAGIDTAIANTERNLVNARGLFDSYMNSVFGGAEATRATKKLAETVESTCSLSYGIVQSGKGVPNGLPIVRPTDLGERVIRTSKLKRIDPERASSYSRTTLAGRELLLCVRGTTGAIAEATADLEGANVTRGIVPIRFEQSLINQKLGYYLLKSQFVQEQIAHKTYGAALMQINIRDLRNIMIPIPDEQMQRALLSQLAEFDEKTEYLESIYEQKFAALTELKQSLLQKAFSGELTAQSEPEPVEVPA